MEFLTVAVETSSSLETLDVANKLEVVDRNDLQLLTDSSTTVLEPSQPANSVVLSLDTRDLYLTTIESESDATVEQIEVVVLEPVYGSDTVVDTQRPQDRLVVSESDISTSTSYYGGLRSTSGSWQINRWVGTTRTIATQASNPLVPDLASAWSGRLTLNYT